MKKILPALLLVLVVIVLFYIWNSTRSFSLQKDAKQPSGETMCTQDAMQCPDGTYVGRTGPNCEFKC